MKLYSKILDSSNYRLSWDNIKDRYDGDGKKIDYESPFHQKEDGWYELEREPNLLVEYLEYDEQNDCILIKKREKGVEELEAEKQAEVKRQLVDELPDIILQNKDNPEALVQALCDRAKQIETETTSDHERNPKAV